MAFSLSDESTAHAEDMNRPTGRLTPDRLDGILRP